MNVAEQIGHFMRHMQDDLDAERRWIVLDLQFAGATRSEIVEGLSIARGLAGPDMPGRHAYLDTLTELEALVTGRR